MIRWFKKYLLMRIVEDDIFVLFNVDYVILRGLSRKDLGDFRNEINEVLFNFFWEWGVRCI